MATVAAYFPPRRRRTPAAGSFRQEMLAYARTLMGVPYEINLPGERPVPGSRGWGKQYPDPDKGLDCSGYVLKVLQHSGLLADMNPLFTGCDALWARCTPISQAAAQPGDLVFFRGTYDTPGMSHIGFVTEAGGTTMISARQPGVGADRIAGSWQQHLAGFGRLPGMPDEPRPRRSRRATTRQLEAAPPTKRQKSTRPQSGTKRARRTPRRG
jgi:cell wall-associated NlpC family hydrolase